MKHIIFSGGLGNQMFQYALLVALQTKGFKTIVDLSFYNYTEMHNGYELEKIFGIDENTISKQGLHLLWLRFLDKFHPTCLCSTDNLHFDSELLIHPKQYIRGYWQCEDYFKDVSNKIRGLFVFRNIDSFNKEIAESMHQSSSVSLHIRRGDYTSFGMPLVNEDFYRRAVEIISEKVTSARYYVFSDDMDEAQRIANLLNIDYQLMNHNSGVDSYKDMYLMSQCKHNIKANSSFSWWGAWLNCNPNKIVIAPKWLNDFNCKSWIELD